MYEHIIQAVIETPWAILPGKLALIQQLITLRAQGHRLTPEEIKAQIQGARPQNNTIQAGNGIAIIPIVGTIMPRADMLMESSGAVSTQRLAAAFRSAMNNQDVGSIIFDMDSPGGQVGGVDELATEIFQARGQKRIVAVANHLAASAAYWLATAADELVITPSGEVGSIGVFAMHQDISQALETEGVKVQLIAAGKYKTEGNPFEPLTEEARAAIQGRVDDYYQAFAGAVARNRGVKRSEVVGGFGEGRVVGAKQAVALGMADRVATLDETIDRLRGKTRGRGLSAESRERRLKAFSHGWGEHG